MTTPPDPLAALGFAAAHGLDASQSTDDYLADLRGDEADDHAVLLTPEAERRARWRAYARTTNPNCLSDELFAETRDRDAVPDIRN
jgi:hypothetical protein